MKYILQTDNEIIEIPIIRSKRKTLGLEVKYDGTVNARVPMRAPREIIERFIREHEAWIIRKRQEWSLAGNNRMICQVFHRSRQKKEKRRSDSI